MSTETYIISHNPTAHPAEQWEIRIAATGKLANARSTEEKARELVRNLERTVTIDAQGRPVYAKQRRTPSQRAWERGASYGVNGQIWDEDI